MTEETAAIRALKAEFAYVEHMATAANIARRFDLQTAYLRDLLDLAGALRTLERADGQTRAA